MGNRGRLPALLAEFAALELAADAVVRATELAAASSRFADEIGGQPAEAVLQAGQPLADARRRLDRGSYDAAVAAGQALTLDEAVALVLGGGND